METESPSPEQLLGHSRAELDELAAAAGVENPAGLPNKQAVAEAILAAGESEPAPVYTVHLVDEFNGAQFHADGAEVELDAANPSYSTSNRGLYLQLLELPFLHDPDAPAAATDREEVA